jgi:hypothetical protein
MATALPDGVEAIYRQTGIRGVTTAVDEIGGWQRWLRGSTVGRL